MCMYIYSCDYVSLWLLVIVCLSVWQKLVNDQAAAGGPETFFINLVGPYVDIKLCCPAYFIPALYIII